jgi:hypothetical protein
VVDTIDLQDQHSPSAQDHSRQPNYPSRIGAGRPAPHQNESLRHAEQVSKEEQMHGPRILEGPRIVEDHHSGIDIIYDDADDMIGDAAGTSDGRGGSYRHGIVGVSTEGDLADSEGDDILDDDLDKISSSPSIDDGGYFF